MESDQQQRFADAVERKKAEADARARTPSAQNPAGSDVDGEVQRPEIEHGRPQDVYSVRDKNSGKGKKTADKWNQ